MQQGRPKPSMAGRMQGPSWNPLVISGTFWGCRMHSAGSQWSGRQHRQDPADLERAVSGFCDQTTSMTSLSHSAMSVITSFGPRHQTTRHHQAWNTATFGPLIAARLQHLRFPDQHNTKKTIILRFSTSHFYPLMRFITQLSTSSLVLRFPG